MQDPTTCPNCGTARAGDARFCANCGLDFNVPAAESTPAAPSSPAPTPTSPAAAPPTQAQHTITVQTDGLVQSAVKMVGGILGCGCLVFVVGIVVLFLLIWLATG